jgi:hypothetical protein
MRRPKSKPPEKREHQWAITLIRQRGKFLGYVTAPDQETAIQEAWPYRKLMIEARRSGRRMATVKAPSRAQVRLAMS